MGSYGGTYPFFLNSGLSPSFCVHPPSTPLFLSVDTIRPCRAAWSYKPLLPATRCRSSAAPRPRHPALPLCRAPPHPFYGRTLTLPRVAACGGLGTACSSLLVCRLHMSPPPFAALQLCYGLAPCSASASVLCKFEHPVAPSSLVAY